MSVTARLLLALLIIPVAVSAKNIEQTLLEYGEQCAQEVGQIPEFDCNSGTTVPVTVDGKPPKPNEVPMLCDKPSLINPTSNWPGQCMPYSKVLNLSSGKTQIAVLCHREKLRDERSPLYDAVDVVVHHVGNGKTCWFHAEPKANADGVNASRVPPPNEKTPPQGHVSSVEFWMAPKLTAQKQCASCHDAGPFIFSPWIGQVWDKVPTDPFGKYSSIGAAFSSWSSHAVSTPGNTCIGCHRIGDQHSCDIYLPLSVGRKSAPGNDHFANSFPLDHWMPIDNNMSRQQWNEANLKSVDELLACCKDRNRKNPDCKFSAISSGADSKQK
jgi:hypothetical protein